MAVLSHARRETVHRPLRPHDAGPAMDTDFHRCQCPGRLGRNATMPKTAFRLAILSALTLCAAAPASAQSVAEFYRGKTVNVYIGVGTGGEYDLQARLVARHI